MPSAVAARCTRHGLPLLASLQKPERKRSSKKATAQRGRRRTIRARRKSPIGWARAGVNGAPQCCRGWEGVRAVNSKSPHRQKRWYSAVFRGFSVSLEIFFNSSISTPMLSQVKWVDLYTVVEPFRLSLQHLFGKILLKKPGRPSVS